MPSKVWDEITYPVLKFNGCTIVFGEWVSNFIPHFVAMQLLTTLLGFNSIIVISKMIACKHDIGNFNASILSKWISRTCSFYCWKIISMRNLYNVSSKQSSCQRVKQLSGGRWEKCPHLKKNARSNMDVYITSDRRDDPWSQAVNNAWTLTHWPLWNFNKILYNIKIISVIESWGRSCETALMNIIGFCWYIDKSAVGQVMAWCHEATGHYLS